MKLTIELIPKSCHTQTLQNQVRRSTWEKLCKKVYKQQTYHCAVCGKIKKPLYFQEVWEYHDLARIQKLTGVRALCPLCYYTKNIEQARILARRKELDMQHIEEHFCRLNTCSPDTFKQHEAEVRRKWKRRNRQKWKTDLGDYAELVAASLESAKDDETRHLRRTEEQPALVKAALRREEEVTGQKRKRGKVNKPKTITRWKK